MKQLVTSILAAAASVALGDGIHIGTGATSSPDSAIAIGDGAHANGAGVVAIGNGTTATSGVAIGGFQLMDASGNIPAARLANAPVPSETDPTVSAWAKAASKPSYAWSEIGSKPAFAAVATSGAYSDLSGTPSIPTDATVAGWGYIKTFTETDPTVSAWAKAASKPSYAWSEIGSKPTFAAVATSGAYSDLSGTPSIPTALSQLTADTTHRLVTDSEMSSWNGKQAAISDLATIRAGAALGATALQSYTETDPNVPAWAKTDSKPSYAWSEITSRPTIPTALSQLSADATHRLVTDSEKSTWNGKQNALTAGANITISGNTISATIPAPSITVSWNTAAKGANPTEALAVASCTYYKRTGSGAYTFSAITGLTAVPTYFVLEGFSSLVLPASVQTVGSGIFRSGKKNHFTMWTTPSGTFVNFLFALP